MVPITQKTKARKKNFQPFCPISGDCTFPFGFCAARAARRRLARLGFHSYLAGNYHNPSFALAVSRARCGGFLGECHWIQVREPQADTI